MLVNSEIKSLEKLSRFIGKSKQVGKGWHWVGTRVGSLYGGMGYCGVGDRTEVDEGDGEERKCAWTWADSLVSFHLPCIDLDTRLNALRWPRRAQLAARAWQGSVFRKSVVVPGLFLGMER